MITKRPISYNRVLVTFSMPSAIWANCIHLVGDFNDWSKTATPLTLDDNGWCVSLVLEAERIYRYRYLVDNTEWHNDWRADLYAPNEFGGDDSSVSLMNYRGRVAIYVPPALIYYDRLTPMQNDRISELNKLITLYTKTKHHLEMQIAAYLPLEVPFHLLANLDKVEEKLKEIDSELSQIKANNISNDTLSKMYIQVKMELTLGLPYSIAENSATRSKLIKLMALIFDISEYEIEVINIKEGSIIITLILPRIAAEKLNFLYMINDPELDRIKLLELKEIEYIYPTDVKQTEDVPQTGQSRKAE